MAIDRLTVLKDSDKRTPSGQRVRFSIRWVTRDTTRKGKPSRHMHFKEAERCGASHSLIQNDQISVKPTDGGHPVPIHIALITHYNEEPVI